MRGKDREVTKDGWRWVEIHITSERGRKRRMWRGHSGEKIESEDKVKGCRMVKVKADKYY